MQLSSFNPPPPFPPPTHAHTLPKKLKSANKCTDKTKNTGDLLSEEL